MGQRSDLPTVSTNCLFYLEALGRWKEGNQFCLSLALGYALVYCEFTCAQGKETYSTFSSNCIHLIKIWKNLSEGISLGS